MVSSYGGYNISYTKRFYMSMRTLLTYYAERFAANQPPDKKLIRMPYNLVEPQMRSVKWDDIVVLEGYAATDVGKRMAERILAGIKGYPRGIPLYVRNFQKDLTDAQFRRAIEMGIIEQTDRTHYTILWSDIDAKQYTEYIAKRSK